MYQPLKLKQKIDQLRDEVTRVSSLEEKHVRYKEIYELSRNCGYFNRMVEVSRFAFGTKPIIEEDFRFCLMAAFLNEDLESFVSCKKALGEAISNQEAEELELGVWRKNFMILELLKIIKKHLPLDTLSPKEWAKVSRVASTLS